MTLPTLCEHCHNRAHRDDIKCTESCYSLDAYNKEIAKAIAARDKWWIEKIEQSELVNPMLDNCGYLCDSCIWECDCPNNQWQQLKREVGQ